MSRGQRDVKAHNIPGQRDVKLNELAKADFDAGASVASAAASSGRTEPCTYTGALCAPLYLRSKYIQQRQQHQNLFWQFIQLNIPLPRDAKGLNIPLTH